MNNSRSRSQKNFGKGNSNSKNGGKFSKGKPKFNSRTGKGSRYVDPDQRETTNPTNDPSWYGDNNLVKASANLFFTKPFGTTIPLWSASDWGVFTNNAVTYREYSAAGICVLHLVPSFGASASSSLSGIAPLNIASQAIYSFVRHANSGSRNYDAPDLITYLAGIADVYSVISWMQRLYATINRYYPQNRYFARRMVEAMNVDFDSFLGNMAQFNYYINLIISKVSAFAVPGNMSFFTRRAFLYSNIYAEDESVKDQMYMYNPDGFYKYTIDSNYPEAYLKYESWGSTPMTFAGLVTYVNDMVQRFLDSEDIGIMSGDIIKAYGSNIIKLAPFPQDVLIDPVVHDYNVLYQIRNASICGAFAAPDVHQDANKLMLEWDNTITMSSEMNAALNMHKYVLTSNSIEPTSAEVLESTRLGAISSTYEFDGTNWVIDLICGTEVVINVTYHRFLNSSTGLSVEKIGTNTPLIQIGAGSHIASIVSQFKYHPTYFHLGISSSTGFVTSYNGVIQDLDNVVTLDWETLANLHTTAIMNMLAVPAIALL